MDRLAHGFTSSSTRGMRGMGRPSCFLRGLAGGVDLNRFGHLQPDAIEHRAWR